MGKQCELIRDLLPLYVDDACSETSAELVKEHLQDCAACRELYEKMRSFTDEHILQAEKEGVILRHEKKEAAKVVKYLFMALEILFLLLLLSIPLLSDTEDPFFWFAYGAIALYAFPFYLAFIEIGHLICRVLEKRKKTKLERIFDLIGLILAVGIVLTDLFSINLSGHAMLLYLSLGLCVLLILYWIVAAILFQRKPTFPKLLKQKTFWICLASFVLAAAIAAIVVSTVFMTKNVKEEQLNEAYSIGVRQFGSDYQGVYFDIGMEEQHAWNPVDDNPTMTVRWVNDTDHNIQYDMKFYIYRKVKNGWVLCADEPIEFWDSVFTVPAGKSVMQIYSIKGYDLSRGGDYKFVTYVDGKEVWFTFHVAVSVQLPTE